MVMMLQVIMIQMMTKIIAATNYTNRHFKTWENKKKKEIKNEMKMKNKNKNDIKWKMKIKYK